MADCRRRDRLNAAVTGGTQITVPVPSRHDRVRRLLAAPPPGTRVLGFPGPPTDRAQWRARLRGADTVLHFFDDGQLPTDLLLAAAPRTVAIAGPAGGCVDAAALRGAGITVLDTPGAAVRAVAEHTVSLILQAARSPLGHQPWDGRPPPPGVELEDAVLGLVGFGLVARTVARLCQGLGMRVHTCSAHLSAAEAAALGVERVPLGELLAGSDVVSVHLRAAPSTAERLDRGLLGLLRPDTVLVNTARADVIDMAALRELVRAGRLRRVALDVFDIEPLPADDILRTSPGVVVTPHTAWLTGRSIDRMVSRALLNCLPRKDD
ncbi:NAD(P)-dependent oxidoreductase [Streptomyces sp. UMAF16]|nr:NAD(P)-dependent oxidoreductase [Streptomyces sp. UMAF16]